MILALLLFFCFALVMKQKFAYNDIAEKISQDYPIDIELGKCISKNYFTDGMNNCTIKGIEKWEEEINNYSRQIENALPAEESNMFDEAQANWEKYYEKENIFLSNTISAKDGNIHTTFTLIYLYEIVKQRALQLKAYSQNLNDDTI